MTKQLTFKGAVREVYSGKRMFALLALLVKEKVVDLTKASKVFAGNHNEAIKGIRKLKEKYDLDIQIYSRNTRVKKQSTKFFILR